MLLTPIFLAATLLASQPAPEATPCAPTTEIVQTLQKSYGETPFAVALGRMAIPGQPPAGLVLYVNPDTGSWTLTMTPASNKEVSCLLASGEHIATTDLKPRGGQDVSE